MTAPRPHAKYLTVLALLVVLIAFSAWVLIDRLNHDDSRAAASPTTSHSAPPTSSPAPSSSAPHTSSSPAPSRTVDTAAQAAAAEQSLKKTIAGQPSGAVAVAALNTKTGRSVSLGSKDGVWTASSYKLLLSEILLYQHHGSYLSGAEDDNIVRALQESDNVAGYQLWIDIGRNPGQQSGMKALGLKNSKVGQSDPTFTRLTGPDAVTLLKNLVDAKSPLDKSARQYLLKTMAGADPLQRWGVGAAADKGTQFWNKNGWLGIDNGNCCGENDNGRWVVTSLGIVTVHKQQVLMAVLTEHQPDQDSGIALVEKLAKLLATTVAPG